MQLKASQSGVWATRHAGAKSGQRSVCVAVNRPLKRQLSLQHSDHVADFEAVPCSRHTSIQPFKHTSMKSNDPRMQSNRQRVKQWPVLPGRSAQSRADSSCNMQLAAALGGTQTRSSARFAGELLPPHGTERPTDGQGTSAMFFRSLPYPRFGNWWTGLVHPPSPDLHRCDSRMPAARAANLPEARLGSTMALGQRAGGAGRTRRGANTPFPTSNEACRR